MEGGEEGVRDGIGQEGQFGSAWCMFTAVLRDNRPLPNGASRILSQNTPETFGGGLSKGRHPAHSSFTDVHFPNFRCPVPALWLVMKG